MGGLLTNLLDFETEWYIAEILYGAKKHTIIYYLALYMTRITVIYFLVASYKVYIIRANEIMVKPGMAGLKKGTFYGDFCQTFLCTKFLLCAHKDCIL